MFIRFLSDDPVLLSVSVCLQYYKQGSLGRTRVGEASDVDLGTFGPLVLCFSDYYYPHPSLSSLGEPYSSSPQPLYRRAGGGVEVVPRPDDHLGDSVPRWEPVTGGWWGGVVCVDVKI